MSVYTALNKKQLDLFFRHYRLGDILHFEGIKDGIDNTNYFVTTTAGDFVLTIFESLSANELNLIVQLLHSLDKQNIPCASPLLDKQANPLRLLGNKPAAVFSCSILQ